MFHSYEHTFNIVTIQIQKHTYVTLVQDQLLDDGACCSQIVQANRQAGQIGVFASNIQSDVGASHTLAWEYRLGTEVNRKQNYE